MRNQELGLLKKKVLFKRKNYKSFLYITFFFQTFIKVLILIEKHFPSNLLTHLPVVIKVILNSLTKIDASFPVNVGRYIHRI